MFDLPTFSEMDQHADEAALIARIADLERVKAAAAAGQARAAAALDERRRADEAAAGVPSRQRGRGVATMLLERLFDLTADDARRGYTLEVRVSNRKAIDLYERLGFRSRGLRRGYYTDNREDALIMWKDPVGR